MRLRSGKNYIPLLEIYFSFPSWKLHADDIKIYSILDNVCNGADIQVKLVELQNRSDQWHLDISYKKCDALLLTNKKEKPSLALTLCDKQLLLLSDFNMK